MDVLNIVLPIFLIIAAGFVLRHFRIVGLEWVSVLNAFVYWIALPALIIVSFWAIDWKQGSLLPVLGFNLLALLLFAALLVLGLRLFRLSSRLKAAVFLTGMVGNTVYMGFPLAGAALGQHNFSQVVAVGSVHLVIGLVFAVLAAEFYVLKSRDYKVYLNDFIRHPLIISLAAGITLSLLRLNHPALSLVQKPLVLLGSTASPVALFTLGGFLHGRFYHAHFKAALAAALVKLALFPLFIWLLGTALHFNAAGLQAPLLLGAMPTAVTAFVIAEKYRLDKDLVANAILISTAASVVTITGLLLIF